MSEFNNSNLDVLYSTEDIAVRVKAMGEQIRADYADTAESRGLVLIGILKGSCLFLADLMRAIDLKLSIDFMAVSSYKDGTVSTGDVEILKDLTNSIRGKDVIICEDIVDTGLTLFRLTEILASRGAHQIRIASLLSKPAARKKDIQIDYCGFEVPDRFVIGYGLDAAERYRNLPFIAVVRDPAQLG